MKTSTMRERPMAALMSSSQDVGFTWHQRPLFQQSGPCDDDDHHSLSLQNRSQDLVVSLISNSSLGVQDVDGGGHCIRRCSTVCYALHLHIWGHFSASTWSHCHPPLPHQLSLDSECTSVFIQGQCLGGIVLKEPGSLRTSVFPPFCYSVVFHSGILREGILTGKALPGGMSPCSGRLGACICFRLSFLLTESHLTNGAAIPRRQSSNNVGP